MPKPYYSDYVNHMIKFYIKAPDPVFRKEVDRMNWNIVKDVFNRIEPVERDYVTEAFDGADTLGDNVYRMAKERRIVQAEIWEAISKVSRIIANERGLI